MHIKDYIQENYIITDGAMGTYYSSKYQEEGLVEQANQQNPKRIKQIHMEYLKAGANLLRTNTFAINSFFVNEKDMKSMIQNAYLLGQEAIKEYLLENPHKQEKIFLAADVGTISDFNHEEKEQVIAEYQKICDAFLEVGATIFWFETQTDLYYLEEILSYLKKQKPEVFVMVSFSFDKTGFTKNGISIERMVEYLSKLEVVDAYGLNCGMDGAHMYQLLEKVTFPNEKPLIALPNAGYPFLLRGKTLYGKNISYFIEMEEKLLSLGVDILGGCCGTTPEYIQRIQVEFERRTKGKKKIGEQRTVVIEKTESDFWRKLQGTFDTKEKPIIVELDPPTNMDIQKILAGAELLKKQHVDLLTLSDSPLARTRMDASLLGVKIQQNIGIPVMPHISCRDRNVISLRGAILGDYVNDIKHFLIVTGDPVAACDRGSVAQVFQYNSIKLMGMLKEMNHDMFSQDKIVYGGALNFHGANIDAIAKRMQLKMEQGCEYFLTQPIYSNEDIERIAELKKRTKAKILTGIMPLVSYRNAMFLANEMPGIHIPKEVLNSYREDMTREEAEQVAVDISIKLLHQLGDVADGYYFMTPFNRVSLICNIIQHMKKE